MADAIPAVPEVFEFCIFNCLGDGWGYNKYNTAVWKHLNKEGHTLVRGLSPRTSKPFIHVFLEDCADDIDCLELFSEDLEGMD